MSETQERTLADLKPGDKIVRKINGERPQIVRVAKITKIHAVLENGEKFAIATGFATGFHGAWSRPAIGISKRDFQSFYEYRAQELVQRSFNFSRIGIEEMRAAADFAEKILRQYGKWDDAPREETAP